MVFYARHPSFYTYRNLVWSTHCNMQYDCKIYNDKCLFKLRLRDGGIAKFSRLKGFVFCSRFVRGLVFKKHAAHKHMPTKYDKPRLLLIQGALGLSSSELSSFESMQQVNNNSAMCQITKMSIFFG